MAEDGPLPTSPARRRGPPRSPSAEAPVARSPSPRPVAEEPVAEVAVEEPVAEAAVEAPAEEAVAEVVADEPVAETAAAEQPVAEAAPPTTRRPPARQQPAETIEAVRADSPEAAKVVRTAIVEEAERLSALVRLGEGRERLPRAAGALARRRLRGSRDRRRPVGAVLHRPRRLLRAPQRAPRRALAPVRRGRHEEEGADRRVRGPARAGRPAQDRRRPRPDDGRVEGRRPRRVGGPGAVAAVPRRPRPRLRAAARAGRRASAPARGDQGRQGGPDRRGRVPSAGSRPTSCRPSWIV